MYLEVDIITEDIEILIPSNLFDEKALQLKLSTKFEGLVNRKTEYKDAFFKDKWKTWSSTIVENDH